MTKLISLFFVLMFFGSHVFAATKSCDRVDLKIDLSKVGTSLALAQALGELTTNSKDPGKCSSRQTIVGIDGFGKPNHDVKTEYIAVGLEIEGDCPGYTDQKVASLRKSDHWQVKSVEPGSCEKYR